MRESGILLHISSLPGPYGVGTIGRQAFQFVDFLKKAGQSCWQILPLNPTGYGDSPYQSCCTFAGNPYFIDLDLLIQDGLLTQQEADGFHWCDREDKANFGLLYENRAKALHIAYGRFSGGEEFDRFCRENSSWLPDYALFMALKDKYHGAPWYQWDEPLMRRDTDAVWQARQELKDSIRYYSFVQYLFFSQWEALHSYAAENGVQFIGDVPIYVPYDSCDVWSNPEYFQLDGDMNPVAVAGCPPDAFSQDGQLWGNPLYSWEHLRKDGYGWWMRRMKAAGKLYDVVRIDHFRGFEAYWAIPFGDDTAKNGKWIKGPGMDFMNTLKKELPELKVIVEDLGFLTQEVLDLREQSGFPGMKILGFAFDSREPSDYLPYMYTSNSVCYTATHDNMTTRQWFETAGEDAVCYAREYIRPTQEEGDVWAMIRAAFASVSDRCIIPIQDYLELGEMGRMNFPGTMTDANWTWRADQGFMSDALAERIYDLTKLYGRVAEQ